MNPPRTGQYPLPLSIQSHAGTGHHYSGGRQAQDATGTRYLSSHWSTLPPAGIGHRTCHSFVRRCNDSYSRLGSISFRPPTYHSRSRCSRSRCSRSCCSRSSYRHSHNSSRISRSYADQAPGSRTGGHGLFLIPCSRSRRTRRQSHTPRNSFHPQKSLHRSRCSTPATHLRSVPTFHRSKKGQRRYCDTIH